MIQRSFDVVTAWGPSVARLGLGLMVVELGPRPEKTLELYEFEGCPFCRKVREALTMLDLDAMIYPCPKRGQRFRPEVVARGGREMFPYLVDPNTGVEMYQSSEIIDYLFEHYGTGKPPLPMRSNVLASAMSTIGAQVSSALRPKGFLGRPSRKPEQPLELYSFEASPYCRLVREELCELELPYRVRNVAKRSPRREEFVARSGKMMVPYLVDPNTGIEMFESADIVRYLREQYAA